MTFTKIYVTELTDSHYVWFGDYAGKVHFGVDKEPVSNSFPSSEYMFISLNNMGVYNEDMYIHFGDCIYKTDEKTLSISQIATDMYNVYFLEKCIVGMQKKPNRLDEMIKIIPADNTIISLGAMQKENVLR